MSERKIIRIEHDDAVNELASRIPLSARLVRLEGFMGVGKTLFGQALAELISAEFVDSDKWTLPPTEAERPYLECLRLAELRSDISCKLLTGRVVFAAVCSQEILPRQGEMAEFSVYLRRLSFSTPNWPYWHKDPDVEEPPSPALERSIYDYHRKHQPHLRADLIVDLPEQGHSLDGALPFEET